MVLKLLRLRISWVLVVLQMSVVGVVFAFPPQESTLTVQFQTVKRKQNLYSFLCREYADGCPAEMHLSYPIFTAGTQKQSSQLLNRKIRDFILDPSFASFFRDKRDLSITDLKGLFTLFVADCNESDPDPWGCIFKRIVTVVVKHPDCLSLQLYEDHAYSGQNGTSDRYHYLNLNPKNGNKYTLADLLVPGFEKPLERLGEWAFKKDEGWSTDTDVTTLQIPCFFKGFHLPNDFLVGPKGLRFVMNAYNCSRSRIFFEIPYRKMRALIPSRGVLADLLEKADRESWSMRWYRVVIPFIQDYSVSVFSETPLTDFIVGLTRAISKEY